MINHPNKYLAWWCQLPVWPVVNCSNSRFHFLLFFPLKSCSANVSKRCLFSLDLTLKISIKRFHDTGRCQKIVIIRGSDTFQAKFCFNFYCRNKSKRLKIRLIDTVVKNLDFKSHEPFVFIDKNTVKSRGIFCLSPLDLNVKNTYSFV